MVDIMKKQLTSFILTVAMIITMVPMDSQPVYATNSPTTIDVSDDSGVNLPDGVTYTRSDDIGVFTVSTGGSIVVTGETDTNTIVVSSGVAVQLVFSGASITASIDSVNSPLDLKGSANVTLTLADGTTSTLTTDITTIYAGIHVASVGGISATLTIDGSGVINATGGYGGAGIGGSNPDFDSREGGNINIRGGIVHASGGFYGAGIGGGGTNLDAAGGAGGNITISSSAKVTTTGGNFGAGIGGGGGYALPGDGGNIIINGGDVDATGGICGAGIGGSNNGASGNITINGGNVIATGGLYGGAGIGGEGGKININGGTIIATGGIGGAGIGGSNGRKGSNIKISDSAVVMAASSGVGNPAIQALSGEGSIINAQLDNAISDATDSYLKCNGNVLKLLPSYTCFAFSASSASPITMYSDADCGVFITDIITKPGGLVSIPLCSTIDSIPTSVKTGSCALTVNLNGGNGPTESNYYVSGAAVSIDAGTKSGYTFNGWTSSDGGTFADEGNVSATFTMPGNATAITANWTQNRTNGYKGGGGNSNTNVTAQLMVKDVEDMALKGMTLTVQAGNVTYNLNTSAIDTEQILEALGTTDSTDIPFNIGISNSNVVINGLTVVVSPVEFTITASYKGKTVNIDKFKSFVNRTIEITGDQAKQITTAVVVEPNGNLSHVPTKVINSTFPPWEIQCTLKNQYESAL